LREKTEANLAIVRFNAIKAKVRKRFIVCETLLQEKTEANLAIVRFNELKALAIIGFNAIKAKVRKRFIACETLVNIELVVRKYMKPPLDAEIRFLH
jgi:hypothetical protein